MKKLFFVLFFILLLANVSAECNETQIDINSASAQELDNITYVGNATALKIIASRPFSSIDDLLNVSGIGPAKLEKIKQQGLACVDAEESSQQETNNSETLQEELENETIEEIKETKKVENIPRENDTENNASAEELSPISLNSIDSKSIKSEENTEFSGKNLAFFGVIAFCVIFGALFLIKKQKYKNEFN